MTQSKIFILLILTSFAFSVAYGGTSGRHIRHLYNPPPDLYEPIVIDAFPFWEKGAVRSYSLKPKYMDTYEIGFRSTDGTFPAKEKFIGKIMVEFFCKNKKIEETEIISIDSRVYVDVDGYSDMTRLKSATFITFDMPLLGKYKEELSVRFSVVNEDQNLAKYRDSLLFYIAVSASP